MEEHVLVCEKVSKRFGQQIAVHDVSLSICPGEIYGLAGPNGAGKTTLISLICGLVRPTSGNIRTFNLHPTQALSDIGVCFQTPSLYSYLFVEKNIRLLSNYPVRAYQYLEQLELDTSILKRRTAILSYGQQKRVGLAISLSKLARLYLLDEPTNGDLFLYLCWFPLYAVGRFLYPALDHGTYPGAGAAICN
ncbi:MAG: ABC transporter ATP-binding protein [Bacillota bacterium]|nr:ABC transporter ATP-binding protein [Bacillota bacterium]